MMDWFDILKRQTGFFTIWNTTSIVRETAMEWADAARPGIVYHHWTIRQQVGDMLIPKLKQMAKEEGLTKQPATHFVNKHFYLKDAQTSVYDKIIFAALKRNSEWRVTGEYAKGASYVKL